MIHGFKCVLFTNFVAKNGLASSYSGYNCNCYAYSECESTLYRNLLSITYRDAGRHITRYIISICESLVCYLQLMIYEKIQALLLLLSKQYSISNAVLRHVLSLFDTGQLGFCSEVIFSEASSSFHASSLLIDTVIEYTMFLDLIDR